MRVLNDGQDKSQVSGVEVFSLLFYSILTAVAVATPALAPLPLMAAQQRLGEPWAKIVAIVGALLSVTVFGESLSIVLIGFSFGLVASDLAGRGVSVLKLFAISLGTSLGAGVFALVYRALQMKTGIWTEWSRFVDIATLNYEQIAKSVTTSSPLLGATATEYRDFLFHQGPFLILGLFALALWFCVGLAAHLGWWNAKHPYSASRLRQVRLPIWVSIAFVLSMFVGDDWRVVQFLLGIAMVIQGTILLSLLFERVKVASWGRSIVYALSMTLGLGAVAGLGVLAPLFFKRIKQEA